MFLPFKTALISNLRLIICIFAFVSLNSKVLLLAADWPQYLGPNRNAIYPDKALTKTWPDDGPKVVWRKKDIGEGLCGLVVSGEKAILFHEIARQDVIECLNAKTGRSIWSNQYPTSFSDSLGSGGGPRATPAIIENKVYTMGAQGMVVCTDMTSGKTIWQVDAQKKFRAPNGFFGMACSPLIEGNALLLNIGGENGMGIVALNKINGKLLWKTLDDEASYSSPVMATLQGKRRAVFFTRSGLAVINPIDGNIDYQQHWRSRIHASVNAAAPLVVADQIFITSSYNTGALVIKSTKERYKKIWSNDTSLSSQYASVMHKDGFLYGTHGRADIPPTPALRCIELATGKIRWSEDRFGDCQMILCGDRLAALMENGELVLGQVSPNGWKEISRAQVVGSDARRQPALADGRLYVRSKNQISCLEVP
ncbi:MAG: alcohol dehydrogenase [Verrucomicrobiales bacterium]|nr:alcohol dehydrogenase [Verrucomicrobiales bacterium]